MTQILPGTCPDISVIIPTRNRAELLEDALHSGGQPSLDPSRYEVVLVDNASSDDTPARAEVWRAQAPCPFTYLRMEDNRGPSRSRNEGARVARAPLLAFTDSDCRVCADWLEQAVDAFSRDPGISFASGPIQDKPGQSRRFFSVGGAGLGGEDPLYPTANMVYRREALLAEGGFDEGLYGGEGGQAPVECSDTEAAWRLLERGHRAAFVPGLVVYHEVMRVSPWRWIAVNARIRQLPYLVGRFPALRSRLMHLGIFSLMTRPEWYLAVLATPLTFLGHAWALLLWLPYVWNAMQIPGQRVSIPGIPSGLGRAAFLALRHAFLTAWLLQGSLRARTLVL